VWWATNKHPPKMVNITDMRYELMFLSKHNKIGRIIFLGFFVPHLWTGGFSTRPGTACSSEKKPAEMREISKKKKKVLGQKKKRLKSPISSWLPKD
jgi:hypothetical protein